MPTVTFGLGSLMVGHWAPMPTPASAPGSLLAAGLVDLVACDQEGADLGARPAVGSEDQWALVHVLYADCGCSRQVIDYLLTSERSSSASEWVLLVEEDRGSEVRSELHGQLTTAGLRTHSLTPSALLQRFGLESAPLFLVLGPAREVRFLGGYTARKQGLHYQDINTLNQLRAGTKPSPLPVFGCGVSNALQATLDPLKIKY